MQDSRLFLFLAALLGLLGVALGAFGAHGLKHRLSVEMLAIFETGVRYQMYHALALLFTGLAFAQFSAPMMKLAGWFFFIGTLIFSGSLYALVLSGVRFWGAVTPIGGLLLLAGWTVLLLTALKK